MVPAHLHQHAAVLGPEAEVLRDLGDQAHADVGVVLAGAALADVVQEGADQQQVGPVDVAGVRARLHGGLEQVPVDGVAVDGVVLRGRADDVPVRDQRGDDARLVQGLPDRDRAAPGAQQRHQRVAGGRRPRHRHRRGLGGQARHCVPAEQVAGLGRCGGRPQDERGITVGPGIGGQDGLPVLQDHAVGQRAARRNRAWSAA